MTCAPADPVFSDVGVLAKMIYRLK